MMRSGRRARAASSAACAVGDRLDLVVLGEQPAHVLAQVGVVVGEQDARRVAAASPARRRRVSGSQLSASAT